MTAALRLAARALAGWEGRATCIPDPEVRRQALGSLRHKAFHSLGAAMFAAAVPARRFGAMVRFCVAYQTLSDYLDNLCDRSRPLGGAARRRLHQAMVAALRPARAVLRPRGRDAPATLSRAAPLPHEPARHPAFSSDDGGYLQALVAECQEALGSLGTRGETLELARVLALLYAQMQARKHAPPGTRRWLVARWAARLAARGALGASLGELAWWELAAAAGSTLGVFALVAADARGASRPALRQTLGAYFPWICAWHILLDYAIDQAEDRSCGELNFAACYPHPQAARSRLVAVFRRARAAAALLWEPAFHRLVVTGMAALYLTDAKAAPWRDLLRCLEAEESWIGHLRPFIEAWRRRHVAPPQVRPLTPAATGGRPWPASPATRTARGPAGAGAGAGESAPSNSRP